MNLWDRANLARVVVFLRLQSAQEWRFLYSTPPPLHPKSAEWTKYPYHSDKRFVHTGGISTAQPS